MNLRMSGAQFVEFSLEFMQRNGLTTFQNETMVNLSKEIRGTPDSLLHWVNSVKAMIGPQKYKKMREEFQEHVKRDVGFLPITNFTDEVFLSVV